MILDTESWTNIRRFRALHKAGATFAEIGRECGMKTSALSILVRGWYSFHAAAGPLGDRLADVAACDVDPDDLRPTDRFGAERLGEHRAERLGEEPVGVFLRLPEGDEPEPAVVGSSDIAPSTRGGASPSSARTLSNCSIDPNGGMATVIHCMAVLLDVS